MTTWEPYEAFRASCLALRSCGEAPNPSHNCGVHSFRAIEDAFHWASKVSRIRPVIVGLVRSWGTIVEGERGWRAEFAYPSSFFAGFGSRDAQPLANAYGVGFAS